MGEKSGRLRTVCHCLPDLLADATSFILRNGLIPEESIVFVSIIDHLRLPGKFHFPPDSSTSTSHIINHTGFIFPHLPTPYSPPPSPQLPGKKI